MPCINSTQTSEFTLYNNSQITNLLKKITNFFRKAAITLSIPFIKLGSLILRLMKKREHPAKELLRAQELYDLAAVSRGKDDQYAQEKSKQAHQHLASAAGITDKRDIVKKQFNDDHKDICENVCEASPKKGDGGATTIMKTSKSLLRGLTEMTSLLELPPHENITQHFLPQSLLLLLMKIIGKSFFSIPVTTLAPLGGVPLQELCCTENTHGGKKIPFSAELIKCFLQQTLRGLDHLHQNGFIHMDIKPENILAKPDGRINIIDLEMIMKANNTDTITGGTVYYMAPEVLHKNVSKGMQKITPKADIYSLGVTFTSVLARGSILVGIIDDNPSTKKKHKIQLKAISSPEGQLEIKQKRAEFLREDLKESLSSAEIEQLINLLERMCDLDPEKRPSAQEVLNDPFLAGFVPAFLKNLNTEEKN